MSSVTSIAPASTITMASSVRDHDDVQQAGLLLGATVGLATSLPSSKPTRTAAIGVVNGKSEINAAAEAAGDADHVRIVFAVRGKHHGDDLRFIAPGFGKQRAQRAVDHARSQNFALRGAPFALEKAAGNFSGGIGVFAVVHGERKKIAVIRLGIHAGGDQHDGIAIARQNGAVGLLGNFSGFQSQRASADFDGNLMGSWCCLRHILKSFRSSAASRTIGPCARGKPFECGRNYSRFVWKRKRRTTASGVPESAYKKSGRAIIASRPPESCRTPRTSGDVVGATVLPPEERLLAQTKAFDNLAIPIRVTTVEVIQKRRRLLTIMINPRRDAWSLRCDFRCVVR